MSENQSTTDVDQVSIPRSSVLQHERSQTERSETTNTAIKGNLNEMPYRDLKASGHVGFDSLPDQLVLRATKRGFHFNVLCIGETGIGKSTLMSTLFNSNNFDMEQQTHSKDHVSLKISEYDLKESGVQLNLSILETVGYGDQINRNDSYEPVLQYINEQFERYLQEELKIRRNLWNYTDTRVHVCLYFISPTGHNLKAIDLMTMKALETKVPIIPLIAKADTISKHDLTAFKQRIIKELNDNHVKFYQFPVDSKLDERTRKNNNALNHLMPFAVVGSVEEHNMNGKITRARKYPWGTVEVENKNHCEFVHLRNAVLRQNLEDLRETTHNDHYELFRREKLKAMGFDDENSNSENHKFDLSKIYEQKRDANLLEMERETDQMRQVFVARVKEKETELKEQERELHDRFDRLKKMHADEKDKLIKNQANLENEMEIFNRRKMEVEAMMGSKKKNTLLR